MVGLGRRHLHEALPADATSQRGRPVRRRSSRTPAPQNVPKRRQDRRRQPADLQPVFSRQNRLRHGQGRDECLDQGAGYGL